ncbi:MAG: pentachlorophenol monooxygenase [Alphaproteobacteria bacterium]|nr:pentachlorophenol monooxygenase [Alphaproteobacteria bacterium]
MADIDVLIAGAGPAGLVLACDLARRGVSIRIVEASPMPPDHRSGSRGKGIQPRTLEIYDDLGIVDAVHEAGGPYSPALAWDGPKPAGLAKFHRIERRAPTPDVPYPSMWMLPQPRALEMLRERLEGFGAAVEFGTRLLHFEQAADGVAATLQRAGAPAETVRARYIAGCDGARGVVRAATGVEFASETIDPHPMITADVVIDGDLDREHWHMWDNAPGGALWLGPLVKSNAFQLYAKFENEEPDLSFDALRKLIVERTQRPDFVLREVLFASHFGSRSGMARHFRAGRAFLAGDAAHVHPPAGGQGMNTAVQDAYNLGWKLGQVLRHGAPDALLDSYEAERLPVAANLLEFVVQMHKDWLGKAKDKEEPRKGEHMQLSLNYRGGPLSVNERPAVGEGGTCAGDRAPDARLADASGAPVRLFDILRGPHFTLLAFGGSILPALDPRYRDAVRAIRVARMGEAMGEGALTDPGGEAHRIYGDGLILVRPDGYVGYTGAAAAGQGLAAYLSRFFG